MCTLFRLFGKACSCAFQVRMGWTSSCLVRINRNAFRHSHPFKNGKTCIRHQKSHNDVFKRWGCLTRNWFVFFPLLLNSTPFQIWSLKISFCEDWGTPLRQGGVKKKQMGLRSHRPVFVPCDCEPHYTASLRCSFLILKLGPFCLTVFLRTGAFRETAVTAWLMAGPDSGILCLLPVCSGNPPPYAQQHCESHSRWQQ